MGAQARRRAQALRKAREQSHTVAHLQSVKRAARANELYRAAEHGDMHAVLRRPIELVRARRPFDGLEVRDGVGLLPGFPERLRAAAGLGAHPCGGSGCPRAPGDTKLMDGAASKTERSPWRAKITPQISQGRA